MTTLPPCASLPASRREASIRCIREEIAARVNATSLRRVAREVGMSPTGLRKFLDGADPYSPTVHRLRVWYLKFAIERAPAAEVSDA
jgi:hypothetical protein